MAFAPCEVSSRSRRAREGGWLGRRRNYRCRKCDAMFQVDTRFPLPEDRKLCPDCRGEDIKNARS